MSRQILHLNLADKFRLISRYVLQSFEDFRRKLSSQLHLIHEMISCILSTKFLWHLINPLTRRLQFTSHSRYLTSLFSEFSFNSCFAEMKNNPSVSSIDCFKSIFIVSQATRVSKCVEKVLSFKFNSSGKCLTSQTGKHSSNPVASINKRT